MLNSIRKIGSQWGSMAPKIKFYVTFLLIKYVLLRCIENFMKIHSFSEEWQKWGPSAVGLQGPKLDFYNSLTSIILILYEDRLYHYPFSLKIWHKKGSPQKGS